MKYIFTLLALFCSVNLFAHLNQKKLLNAIADTWNRNTAKDIFFIEPVESPEGQEIVAELNAKGPLKTYGPYRLMLKGLPPGTRFNLYQFNLLGIIRPNFLYSGYVDQHGEVWTRQKQGDVKLSNTWCLIGDVLPGEPIYSLVVLGSKKTYLATCIVPNPLEVYGKDGRHFAMEFFTPSKPYFCMYGENFKAGEKITLSVHAQEGITTKVITATEKGTLSGLYEGNPQQKNEVEFIEVSTAEQEPMTLHYDWQFLKMK
jgi:hypothetical protein